MSDGHIVDLFVEDRAHEEFLTPLLRRVANEESVEVQIRVRSARGGHARAVAEFSCTRHSSRGAPPIRRAS